MTETAVEWFFEQIDKTYWDYMTVEQQLEILEQAKQMEKDQIKDAWLDAWKDSMLDPLEDKYYEPIAEQYYNETFKSH